ncbi:RETICULON-4-INTERACTING PROTEIN 1, MITOCHONDRIAL [Ceraceosorus bombacis]|uniref:RETICULON-4-INTERACTING PROTEIN 1, MITOCHONDRIAL n=1 Tax=Ceraceosorus bombacis TaxID=401625 RepID=A0A0P1BMP8_9BASI|nr:RETICULON-4-INTERACTING PROTEIN 1, MITOCHONDRIAL [Ceraceosorus bombacis]
MPSSTASAKNKDFLISSLGVDEHVDYTKDDVRQKVTKFQPDAIIDCVGGTECIGIAGNRRYITIVGDKVSRDTMGGPYVYYDLRHPINAVSQWIRWVKGHVGLGESYDIVHLEYEKNWLQEAPETLSTKDIFIDSVHPFERADEAYERLDTGRAKGKVVVEIGA